MKKRLISLFVALLLLAALTIPALADDFSYIYDPDGWMSDEHIAELNKAAEDVYGATGARILFAITDASCDEDALFEEMTGGDHENILMLYADLEGDTYRVQSTGICSGITDNESYMTALYQVLNEAESWFVGAYGYINAAGAMVSLVNQGVETIEPDELSEPDEPDVLIAPAPVEEPMPFSLLMDEAELLSDAEEAALLSQLEDISARCGRDVTVVTVDSMGSYTDPEAFCDYYFESHDYNANTVMLMLAMESRDYRLSVYGNCLTVFPAEQRETICAEIVSYLSAGDYYTAFSRFAADCDEYTEYYDTEGEVYEPPMAVWVIFVCFGIGLAIGLVVTLFMKSKLKSVHFQSSAADYVRAGSFDLTHSHERFLYSHVDRTAKPKNDSSSGGGISSSGHSSGGKF